LNPASPDGPSAPSREGLGSPGLPGVAGAAGLRLGADAGGVLCLHGFTGSPFEVAPLAGDLDAAGFTTAMPLLAGHGLDAAALEVTGWPDWLASAEVAFATLTARVRGPVGVVGFSMGGLLALKLALRHPGRVAALALLSVPMRLRPSQVRGIRLLGYVPSQLRVGPLRAIPKLRGSDVSDPDVRAQNPCLTVMPLPGLESLLRLMAEVRAELGQVRVPTLVAHARLDHTVPLADGLELADRLGAPVVERLWLDRSFHLIGVDVERRIVAEAVTRFMTRFVRG
jgi:carboxylesterase